MDLWKDRKRPIFGLPLSFTRYILRNDRLILSRGLLNVEEDELMLYRVLDFKVELPLSQRLFGVGTIVLITADATDKEVRIEKVKKPREVKDLISKCVIDRRKETRMMGADMVGASSSLSNELGDDLDVEGDVQGLHSL